MERRTAIKATTGVILGGGAVLATLTNAFKPEDRSEKAPENLEYKESENAWKYKHLDPEETAQLAYQNYPNGSCMYAVFSSVIGQLAGKLGEPFASFPLHMMKYGHGGIGGYGTTCGALNGAAALIGLFIGEKKALDILIAGLYRWYEKTPLPAFRPQKPALDFTPEGSVSNSVLCHASNTNWIKKTGYKVNTKERKERCRRLTGDVTKQITIGLNKYFDGNYITGYQNDDSVNDCMNCHDKKGKMANTNGKMSCTSCHNESLGHKIFSDAHYKLMKEL